MILDLPTSMIQVPEGQEWILDMINNILIEVLASMAEQERLTIKKRQRRGLRLLRLRESILADHLQRNHITMNK